MAQTTVANTQPSLALNHFIVTQGMYPYYGDGDGTGAPSGELLGAVRITAASYTPGPETSGQTLLIQQNPALFSLLGANYGGNGSSNFKLPSFGVDTLIGQSQTKYLGQQYGSNAVLIDRTALPTGLGGMSQPIDNYQPSEATQYLIATQSTGEALNFAGRIVQFAGIRSQAPDGFFVADGRAVSRADFVELFAKIGTIYGDGDGSTTFNLPDLRGRAIMGSGGSGTSFGQSLGSETITLQNGNAPASAGFAGNAFDTHQPSLVMSYLIAVTGIYPQRDGGGSAGIGDPYFGEIIAYAGTDVPNGYMRAEGQILSINSNPALHSLLGNAYGGNGTTTFALPDLRGRVAIDTITNNDYGTTSGSVTSTLDASDIPAPFAPVVIAPAVGVATNDDTPTFAGTAQANSFVTVFVNGNSIGTTRADASGNWTYTPATGIGEANHTISARAFYSAGNESTPSTSRALIVDITPPAMPTVDGSGIYGPRPTFTGTAEANSFVSISVDGTLDGTIQADGAGRYSYTSNKTYNSGAHTAEIIARDAVGNVSQAATPTVTIDALSPVVGSVGVPANGIYKAGDVLNFTVSFDEPVIVVGAPQLGLTIGSTIVNANYISGSSTNTLAFSYTVGAGQNDADGITLGNLSLNGGTVRDGGGNDAILTLNSIGSTSGVRVDGVAPFVSSIVRESPTGGQPTNATTLTERVTFSEVIRGIDVTDFTLTTTGTAAAFISSVSGSGVTCEVRMNGVSGNGTLRLDLKSSGTGITDLAGNLITGGFTGGETFTVDTIAPTTFISSSTAANGGATSSSAIAYTVVFSESVMNFTSTDVIVSNGNVSGFSGSGSTYTFSVTPGGSGVVSVGVLANGAQDQAGNGNTAASVYTLTYFQPVTAAPTITSSVNGQPTNDSTPTFTGTAASGSTVAIYVDDVSIGTTTANVGGSFSYTPTSAIPDGAKSVYATAQLSGQTVSPRSASFTFDLDATAPTAAVTSVVISADTGVSATDLVTRVAAQTIAGTLSTPLAAEERIEVSVDDGASWSTATADGVAWSISATLAAGDGVLRARIIDAAGNVGADPFERPYVLDAAAPAAPSGPVLAAGSDTGISQTDRITANTRPNVTGTSEAGSVVILYDTDGSSELGRVVTAGDGRWSITPTAALAEGTHTLTAKAIDVAGNVGTPSSGLLLTIDSTAPVLNVTSQIGAFVGTAQRIAGAVADASDVGATVALREGMRELGTAIVQADRTWSATVDLGSFGNHTVTASATDLAGNIGQVAATFTAVAPLPPGPPPVNPNAPTQTPAAGETVTLTGKTTGSLTVDGAGTLILTGTNTYTEPTTVQAGTLLVNGSIVSPVSVQSGGTLGGSGSVGTVAVEAGGTLSPGNSPGILSTKDLSLAAGAVLKQEIGGTASGQFDQLKVTGTVSLSGASLDVAAFGTFASARGDRFVIIDNDGTDAVSGTFVGLSEGAVLGFGARSLRISYQGGDGNDVSLTDTTGLAFQREAFGTVVTSADSQAGQVCGLYEALLNRAPDALGLSGFTSALENGASLTQVAQAILGSPEHGPQVQNPTAYVQSLYQNLLNRAADASGLATFTSELASGVSQATVAAQIASSAEAKAVLAPAFANGVFVFDASEASVARLYYGLLDRAPDAGGLRSFSAFIETSGAGPAGEAARLGQVASTILTSQEYTNQHTGQSDAAFVFELYQDALGRAPDAGGQAGYLSALAHGVTRTQVALDITQSPEAQVHLVGLIQEGALLAA